MRRSLTKLILTIVMSISLFSQLLADDNFPVLNNETDFCQDLKRASLVNTVPNLTETGQYLGVQLSSSHIYSNSGRQQVVPGIRLSIYPNPGYNLWAQFGNWPGETPAFSVGTGIQIEMSPENQDRREAIGLAWNEVYTSDYRQRDISVHGLYGYSNGQLNLGIIALIDLHHILVADEIGYSDYDETIYLAIPYISWMFWQQLRFSLSMPYNSTGPGLALGLEFLVGDR